MQFETVHGEGEAPVLERFSTAMDTARETVESELHAAAKGLRPGPDGWGRFRKWLGWELFRLAALINPEVEDD